MPPDRDRCHSVNLANNHFSRIEQLNRKPAVGHYKAANHLEILYQERTLAFDMGHGTFDI